MIETEVKKEGSENMWAMALEKIVLMLKKLGADPKTLEAVVKDLSDKVENYKPEEKKEEMMEEKKEELTEPSLQERMLKMCK